MSEDLTKEQLTIPTARCNYCGKTFPLITGTYQGPTGKMVTEQIPVCPVPLPAFKKAPSLISLTNRPPDNSGTPPSLNDRLDSVYVFIPHELVCDRRHRAMNGGRAPAHTSIPEEAIVKPGPETPEKGAN